MNRTTRGNDARGDVESTKSMTRRMPPARNTRTEPAKRRERSAGMAACIMLLLAIGSAGAPSAHAQNTLVSNTGQTARFIASLDDLAQSFRTGSHSRGYILSSVGIVTAGHPSFSARVCTVDSSGNPTSSCTSLTAPSSFAAGTVTFTAPANTTLTANTTYTVRISGTAAGFSGTRSNSEDRSIAPGWSIGSTFRRLRNSSWQDDGQQIKRSLRIRVSGFAINSAGDYTSPTISTTATRPVAVQPDGTFLRLVFNENLAQSNPPPTSAFTITADGDALTVTAVQRHRTSMSTVEVDVTPAIRKEQTVVVRYEDPSGADDTNAIQDTIGNDVADFTETAINLSAVDPAAPDPPTGLGADFDGATTVELEWTAPADTGGRSISGYQIEWAPAHSGTWQDAVANTGNRETTRTLTVPAGEVRRFRVRAINSVGTSEASNVAVGGNVPATGTPTLSGAGRVGQTLSASTSAIRDVNGLPESYTYRWIRVDGSTETDVGTNAATYMPVAADVGNRIKVEVSFTDDDGFAEARTSTEVAIRAAMPPATCPAFTVPAGREQLWAGTVTVGAVTSGESAVAHGYYALFGVGALSDPTSFRFADTDYTVDVAFVFADAGIAPGELVLSLSRGLPDTGLRRLRLHVCGETYALADAKYALATHDYTWGAQASTGRGSPE